MAKQSGIIQLEGTLGNITFFKTTGGYVARQKTSISAARIATDPAFDRTRENNSEFGRAGKAARLLRTVFQVQVRKAKDRRLSSRLTKEMVRVLQADATSIRGQRNVIDGEAELLQGFNCNEGAALASTMAAPYDAVINRATGAVTVSLPAFSPATVLNVPGGATHFRLVSAAAAINFTDEAYSYDAAESDWLPVSDALTTAITLSKQLPAASTAPIFLLLGIDFTQQVNGVRYALKNGSFNALAIARVAGV